MFLTSLVQLSPALFRLAPKLVSLAAMLGLIALLSGCTKKHGFEGEYRLEHTSGIESMDEMLELFKGFLTPGASPIIVIGPDYFDVDGHRTHYDEIFVRESGRHRYLIFRQAKDKTIWKIEDGGKRLEQKNGFIQLTLIRVDYPKQATPPKDNNS